MPAPPCRDGEESLPRVCVAVINWNGKDHVMDCLESVARLDYPRSRLRVTVIDNASTDGSPDRIRERFPEFGLVVNPGNSGCARAENQGIRHAMDHGDPYVWLLNNDVVLDRDCLARLVRAAESDPAIAVAGPAIYAFGKPGAPDHLGYRISLWTGRFRDIGPGEGSPGGTLLETDSVQGCAVLVRTSAAGELGLYHEAFEAYFEESDFHVRARRRGYRVVTVTGAVARHRKAASYNRVMLRRAWLLLRNLFLFEWRNASAMNLAVFIPYYFFIHLPVFLVRGSLYALNHRVRSRSIPVPGHSRHRE
jgi:GT2 family glycosyltransferase